MGEASPRGDVPGDWSHSLSRAHSRGSLRTLNEGSAERPGGETRLVSTWHRLCTSNSPPHDKRGCSPPLFIGFPVAHQPHVLSKTWKERGVFVAVTLMSLRSKGETPWNVTVIPRIPPTSRKGTYSTCGVVRVGTSPTTRDLMVAAFRWHLQNNHPVFHPHSLSVSRLHKASRT